MIYTISDIHGNYKKFLKMLQLIQFSEEDILYIIGDIIDRGENSIKLIKYIMTKKNIILIRGNHEQMFIESVILKDKIIEECWLELGGNTTLEEFNKLKTNEKEKIKNYIMKTSLIYVVDNKYVLTHAGLYIPKDDYKYSLDEIVKMQTSRDVLSQRQTFYNNKGLSNYTIVFGHTPMIYILKDRNKTLKEKQYIWHDDIYKDKIGIDCGVNEEYGRMACLRLDDMKEYYI